MLRLVSHVGTKVRQQGVGALVRRSAYHASGTVGGWIEMGRRRTFETPDEVVDYVGRAAGGYFKPLQVRSEICSLLTLVRELRPRRVMEIGTANGGTLLMWTRVAAPDAQLISLDLRGGAWGGGYGTWKAPVYRRFALPGQRIDQVRGDSHAASSLERVRSLLGGERLDFLMIDGDHSYEGVKQDYEMYAPLVRSGGLVAFHDVAECDPRHQCDVTRLWREVRARHAEQYEFIEDPKQGWGGIGVVRVP